MIPRIPHWLCKKEDLGLYDAKSTKVSTSGYGLMVL